MVVVSFDSVILNFQFKPPPISLMDTCNVCPVYFLCMYERRLLVVHYDRTEPEPSSIFKSSNALDNERIRLNRALHMSSS